MSFNITPQCAWCILLTGEGAVACTEVHGTRTCKEHVRMAMEMSFGKIYVDNAFPLLVTEEHDG